MLHNIYKKTYVTMPFTYIFQMIPFSWYKTQGIQMNNITRK